MGRGGRGAEAAPVPRADLNLSVAVQHHPKRAELLPPLLASLSGLPVDVVADPDPEGAPSAWRTYRACLESTPAWASHRVVLQDDVTVCESFAPVLERAVAARPSRMLVLCVCGQPSPYVLRMFRASQRDESWALLMPLRWVPAIAVVWPVEMIEAGLAFVDEQAWPVSFNADDEIIGRIAGALGEYPLATVPSLVQHEDLVPSVAGRRHAGGRNAARVAPCYVGDTDCDPLSIDWSLGAD